VKRAMDKKILIGIIVVIVVAILAVVLMFGNNGQTITYDEHFNVTVPASYGTNETNGLVSEAYPENKTFVLKIHEEDNMTASSMDSQWALIKDVEANHKEVAQQIGYSKVTDYNKGNNKFYDYLVTNSTAIKSELKEDANIIRCVEVVVPNSDKVYGLMFLSNETAENSDVLYNPEIESIINSTISST
jgi:hypothetical protein